MIRFILLGHNPCVLDIVNILIVLCTDRVKGQV